MAVKRNQDLTEEMKMLNMTREERRNVQRKQLMEQGLKKRKEHLKKQGKY